MSDPDWLADLARYPRRPWLKEQSIWAIAVYRFGRRVDRRKPGMIRKALETAYWLAHRVVETLTGISIPKSVTIGPGLKIWHFGNIFVHADSVLGANCTLRQGVTIGNRVDGGPTPIIEDDVELGAYAQVLGGVRIGRGAKVGAMTVVLRDVPPGAVAVGGSAARIIEARGGEPDPLIGPDPPRAPTRPAVFLDRDGTVIEHEHYLSDPAKVRLIPGGADALRRLRAEGYALVVVTNQSAIGRGMLSVADLDRVNAEMDRQLALEGVAIDGLYYCPEVPTGDDPTAITHDERKPGPGMLIRAARDLGLDLGSSYMVGDMISDVLAGINAGCRRSILVRTGKSFDGLGGDDGSKFDVVADLPEAARLILTSKAQGTR